MKSAIRLGVVAVAVVVTAVAAGAAAPTRAPITATWAKVTDSSGDNTDEVGLARTRDGVVHVAWLRQRSARVFDVMHTAVGRGAATPIASGLGQVENPDLVAPAGGGLHVIFGSTTSEQRRSLATATGNGADWTVGPVDGTRHAYASPVGAAAGKDGSLIAAWATTAGLEVHPGIGGAAAPLKIAGTESCCAYLPDLAVDAATGEAVVAWSSLRRGDRGLFAQRVLPSLGPRTALPRSVVKGDFVSIDQRMAISSRIRAPGVYLAYGSGYPEAERVLLWRFGARAPVGIATGGDVEDVNVAAGPDGRLWVMWQDNDRNLVFGVRSNRAATTFGAIVPVKLPPGQTVAWKVSGEGSLGPLDLFVSASPTLGSKPATWHTRVFPGLSLNARGGKRVTLRVTDAGDAVPGATVMVGGRRMKTNASGRVVVDLPAGTFSATAAKAGFTASASVSFSSK